MYTVDKDEHASDLELAKKAASGNQEARSELYARYGAYVLNLARRMTQNFTEADDLAQEAWINILTYIGTFCGKSKLKTWIFKVTRQKFWNLKSREKGYLSIEESTVMQRSVHTDYAQSLTYLELIDRLPHAYRQLFHMKDIQGLSIDEIAHIFGVKSKVITNAITSAHNFLRAYTRGERAILYDLEKSLKKAKQLRAM